MNENNLIIYAKNLQLEYNNIKRQIELMDHQIAIAEDKIGNATAMYEKGKIAEIQLIELKTELKGLQYERMSLICDAQLIFYLLEHTIENQAV